MPPAVPSLLATNALVVAEGNGDKQFIENLCAVRGIGGFQIEEARGNAKFETHLKGLRDRTGFDNLRLLVVIGDNDDTPGDRFNHIRKSLKAAALPQPNDPFTPVKRDNLTVIIIMLPYTYAAASRTVAKGCLDTVLLPYIENRHGAVLPCVETYHTCVGKADRTKNQNDKFRLRCFIAALFREDPNLALSWVTSPGKNLIDLNDQYFTEFAQYLMELQGFTA